MICRSDMVAKKKKYGRPRLEIGYVEKKCAVCGKIFIPAPQHALRDEEHGKFFCSCSCFRQYTRKRSENKTLCTRNKDFEKAYKPVFADGKEYRHGGYYMKLYSVTNAIMHEARDNGLPYIKQGRYYYYNKQDFFDYWAGKIGKDVRE